jgi:hypothetical protein
VPPPPPPPPPAGGNFAEAVNTFYMCAANTGWRKNGPAKCGLYMPAKFWRRNHPEYTASGQKWYCGVQWDDVEKAFPGTKARMANEYGALPEVGCGAKYVPYARGQAMVLEVKINGGWHAFLADLMPEVLCDEIDKVKASFHKNVMKMTPQQLQSSIPVVCPKVHPVEGQCHQWLGRFPVEDYKESGGVVLDSRGWWLFAQCVASQDPVAMASLFQVASRKLDEFGNIVSEVSMADL